MENEAIIFRENEVNANIMMTVIAMVTIGIVAVTWILFASGFFYISVPFNGLMSFNILLLAVSAGLARYFKYEKPWVKYALMGSLTIVYAVTTSVLTYNVVLLVVIPILLSIRYFDKRYTMAIAVLSIIVFFVAYMYGANHGMLDLNFVQYEPGTKITTNENMWLEDALRGIPYDRGLMLKNTLISNYFVKLLQLIIISVAAVKMVRHGQDMMLRQRNLTEKTTRMGAELGMAANIQSSSLPHLYPAFPERKEFGIFASMDPAKEIGGDFYDFYMLDDDHLALVVADVSGKGIPAALFMMISKTIIRSMAQPRMSPSEILLKSNTALWNDNDENMFVTVWLGILTISTGELVYASAGHERPILYQNGDWQLLDSDHSGIALSMCEPDEIEDLPEKYQIRDRRIDLQPGDVLFQYTDGVVEAINSDEEQFGEERLMQSLRDASDLDPAKLLPYVRGRVNEFVQEAAQFDDITMLGIIYKGN